MTKRQAVEQKIRELVPSTTIRVGGTDEHPIARVEPIRLADVLMALQGELFCVTPLGYFSFQGEGGAVTGIEPRWPLDTNNLNDAGDECIEFLHEVLISKE